MIKGKLVFWKKCLQTKYAGEAEQMQLCWKFFIGKERRPREFERRRVV